MEVARALHPFTKKPGNLNELRERLLNLMWDDVGVVRDRAGLEQAAQDTFHRGLADALILSGRATGKKTDLALVDLVKRAVPEAPVLIGSGITPDTAAEALAVGHGRDQDERA